MLLVFFIFFIAVAAIYVAAWLISVVFGIISTVGSILLLLLWYLGGLLTLLFTRKKLKTK